MSRIIIFTGKGGVGKTSVAAAHGRKSSKEGKKTLLVSTDMAHNLSDLFGISLGKEPVSVDEMLDVYEIDPNYVMEHDFKDMMAAFEKMIPSMMNGCDITNDMVMFPGSEELFSLLKISELHKSEKYERIIVDCAPTGETLSLLKFPELLSWYMEKLFPIGKLAVRVISPFSKRLFKVEMPDKKAMSDIQALYLKMIELQELLKDSETTSIRIVTIPEKMIVEETKRNYMYMNLYNFNVDGIYINRILPKDMNNDFFEQWMNIQEKYIAELNDNFTGIPICYIPWYGEELSGVKAIDRICDEVLTEEAVFDVRKVSQRECYEQNEKGYLLKVSVPGASKKELELFQSGMDVVIRLGNFKRNIPLPNVLRNYDITMAKIENGVLNIQFEKNE